MMVEVKKKAVILLSAGLDSTTNLFAAVKELEVIRCITFDYGQRAARKEIRYSRELCKGLGIEHTVIELPWLSEGSASSLINRSLDVPRGDQVSIDDISISIESKKSVWVPNRNGVFLSIGAAVAESLDAQWVIPGFNREEAITFPDNSKEYIESINDSLVYSTENHVKVICYTIDMDKSEIVQFARELKVPFNSIWPCYFDGEEICRECESCQRFIRAVGK